MTETQSYPIDLVTAPLFWQKHNISFSDDDFDGTGKLELVVSTTCPDDVSDCIDSDGVLTSDVTVSDSEDFPMTAVYGENSYDAYYKITSDITMSLSEDIDVKGMFLRKKSNGFVIAYMVNQNTMRFCDSINFEENNVVFEVRR